MSLNSPDNQSTQLSSSCSRVLVLSPALPFETALTVLFKVSGSSYYSLQVYKVSSLFPTPHLCRSPLPFNMFRSIPLVLGVYIILASAKPLPKQSHSENKNVYSDIPTEDPLDAATPWDREQVDGNEKHRVEATPWGRDLSGEMLNQATPWGISEDAEQDEDKENATRAPLKEATPWALLKKVKEAKETKEGEAMKKLEQEVMEKIEQEVREEKTTWEPAAEATPWGRAEKLKENDKEREKSTRAPLVEATPWGFHDLATPWGRVDLPNLEKVTMMI